MSKQSVNFAGRTWQPSGGVWLSRWNPPVGCPLRFEPRVRVVGRHDFDDLETLGGHLPEVTEEQKKAACYFFQNHVRVIDEVVRQLLRYCRRIHAEDPVFFAELADVQSVEKLIPQLGELQIAVEHDAVDGTAWMSMTGDCDWEIEHGLGICVWQDIVLDIGTYDTVLSGPDPEFTCLPALDDTRREQTRRRAIQALGCLAAEAAEKAEQAALESMPDSVRLVMALTSGNAVLANELVARGVRLDELPAGYPPPVFLAIQACDPPLLQQMLELGARTDVLDDQQQSPSEVAEQRLREFRLSQSLQQGVLGDLSAITDGEQPAAGGLLSMLGQLQSEAGRWLAELEDKTPPVPPAWDPERAEYHRSNVQHAASEVNTAIPRLEKILQMLSATSP